MIIHNEDTMHKTMSWFMNEEVKMKPFIKKQTLGLFESNLIVSVDLLEPLITLIQEIENNENENYCVDFIPQLLLIISKLEILKNSGDTEMLFTMSGIDNSEIYKRM